MKSKQNTPTFVFRNILNKMIKTTNPANTDSAWFAMALLHPTTKLVMAGIGSPGSISSNIFENLGTIKIIKPAVMVPAMNRTAIGYINADLTLPAIRAAFSINSASRTRTTSMAPEASPARTMLT